MVVVLTERRSRFREERKVGSLLDIVGSMMPIE